MGYFKNLSIGGTLGEEYAHIPLDTVNLLAYGSNTMSNTTVRTSTEQLTCVLCGATLTLAGSVFDYFHTTRLNGWAASPINGQNPMCGTCLDKGYRKLERDGHTVVRGTYGWLELAPEKAQEARNV